MSARQTRRCAAGCGWPLDVAATKDWNGRTVYDRHPGCEPGGQQLRLIKGEKQ